MRSRVARVALFVVISAVLVITAAAQTPAGGNGAPASAPAQGKNEQNAVQPEGFQNGNAGGRIAAGTEIHATLDTPLSTKTSKPGDRFTATIADEVRGSDPTNGSVIIPGGARLEGEVAEADANNKALATLPEKSKLSVRFRDVVLPNGQTLPLTATLISVHDTSGKNVKKIEEEGRMQPGARSDTVGAGIGTPTGLVFGGPVKGLAIGAMAGGGYVLSTSGKDVNLPAQTGMVIRLDQSISWNGTSASIR